MGHRALVIYEVVPNEKYVVNYSHWGGYGLELMDQISPEAPFGSENMEPGFMTALLAAFESGGLDAEGHATNAQEPTPVDPRPRAVKRSLKDAIAYVDYLSHESVYIVDVDFNVTGLIPLRDLSYEPEGEVRHFSQGALIITDDPEEWHDIRRSENRWEREYNGIDTDLPSREQWELQEDMEFAGIWQRLPRDRFENLLAEHFSGRIHPLSTVGA